MTLAEATWTDPERLSGAPCFRGTRVPVELLMQSLQDGLDISEFLEGYPPVTREQVLAVLAAAGDAVVDRATAA